MSRIVIKQIPKRPASYGVKRCNKNNEIQESSDNAKKNKKNKKNNNDMIDEMQISEAEMKANDLNSVKVVKKERGLIERTESSKIILTEDNRQVLND